MPPTRDSVANSALDEAEKQSLAGSLKRLHQESIGRAGKRIAATLLPTGTYGGVDAAKYFRKCTTCAARLYAAAVYRMTTTFLRYLTSCTGSWATCCTPRSEYLRTNNRLQGMRALAYFQAEESLARRPRTPDPWGVRRLISYQ
jgi:hypothetical protein